MYPGSSVKDGILAGRDNLAGGSPLFSVVGKHKLRAVCDFAITFAGEEFPRVCLICHLKKNTRETELAKENGRAIQAKSVLLW
jgi:hypothetical protein